jgi:hypothetical protein
MSEMLTVPPYINYLSHFILPLLDSRQPASHHDSTFCQQLPVQQDPVLAVLL